MKSFGSKARSKNIDADKREVGDHLGSTALSQILKSFSLYIFSSHG